MVNGQWQVIDGRLHDEEQARTAYSAVAKKLQLTPVTV